MLSHEVVWLIHSERQREIERRVVASGLRKALRAAQRSFASGAREPAAACVAPGQAVPSGQR